MNVYILLDASGSMSSQWSDTLGGINGYIKNLSVDTNVVFATFTTKGYAALGHSLDYRVVRECKAREWREVTIQEVQPTYGTPLLDAAAKIMDTAFATNSERTVLVIMTDGEENASQVATKALVEEKMKRFEDRKWEVVFLGADFKGVEEQSRGLGIASNKTMNTSRQARGFAMGSTLASATTSYFAKGEAMNFSAEAKAAAEK